MAITHRKHVEPAFRKGLIQATACHPVKLSKVCYLIDPTRTPKFGDVALVKITSVGYIAPDGQIENAAGAKSPYFGKAQLFPGSLVLAPFAPRAGAGEFVGVIPKRPRLKLHLLSAGGPVGLIVSKNSLITVEPTTVRLLGFAGDKQGKVINTLDYGLKGNPQPHRQVSGDPTLILVIGTQMDAGKSNAAKAIVYNLSRAGHQVVAGKATGLGQLRDIALTKMAGARDVIDTTYFGYPSTVGLPKDEVLELFWRVYNWLHGKLAKSSARKRRFIVIEIADGLLFRETNFILRDSQVKESVDRLVFCCHDILGAEKGCDYLTEWGYSIAAVSGKLTNSQFGRDGVAKHLTGVATFDSMSMEADETNQTIRSIFT